MGNKHNKPQHNVQRASSRTFERWPFGSILTKKHPNQQIQQAQTTKLSRSQTQFLVSSREDLLHLPAAIIHHLTTYLNVTEIHALKSCNLRLYCMISDSKCGLAQNFHTEHLPSLRIEQRSKLSATTQFDWTRMYKRQFQLNKYSELKRLPPSLPTLLPESFNEHASTRIQQAALRYSQEQQTAESFNLNSSNQFVMDDQFIKVAESLITNDSGLVNYQNVLLNPMCPAKIKDFIIQRLWMEFYCQYFKQLLWESMQLEDKVQALNLFSIAWNHYLSLFLDVQDNWMPQASITYTDMLINDWQSKVLTQETGAYFVSTFSDLLNCTRKNAAIASVDMLLDSTSTIDNTAQSNQTMWIKTLRQSFSVVVDTSCLSNTVQHLGHSNFEGNRLFADCLEIQNHFLTKLHQFCDDNLNNDLEQAITIFKADLEVVRQVFGPWVVQEAIEPNHIAVEKQLLKDFLKREHQQVNLIKIVDLEDEEQQRDVMFHSDILDLSVMLTSSFDMMEHVVTMQVDRVPDLLVQMIKESIKEIQLDKDLPIESSFRRWSSDASTCSSLGSSSLKFTDNTDHEVAEKIATYIRRHHPSVSEMVNLINRQEAKLSVLKARRVRSVERCLGITLSKSVGPFSMADMISSEFVN